MIEPMKQGMHGPQVRLVCDDCGKGAVVTCGYVRVPGNDWRPNEGQAFKKAVGMKWSHVKGVLRCKDCEAKRKAPKAKETPVAEKITDLRQPTRDQKRQIVLLLTDVYDTERGRYRGQDTDKTVAEVLGAGVMPGWVAAIREEMFGPEGGNDELESLLAEVRDEIARMEASAKASHDAIEAARAALKGHNDAKDKLAGYLARIEAIKAAVGPRAARA